MIIKNNISDEDEKPAEIIGIACKQFSQVFTKHDTQNNNYEEKSAWAQTASLTHITTLKTEHVNEVWS